MTKLYEKEFTIRQAEEKDIPLIHNFIIQLAEYEKMLDEVEATQDLLKKHLFGKKSFTEVIIGIENRTPVGFALYFHNFSTFLGKPGLYLEDLFVLEKHRGKGYGKAMLTHLAKIAVDRDCGRLEWSVLNWNKPAIKFYESLGATPLDGWTVYRLTGQNLTDLASSCLIP